MTAVEVHADALTWVKAGICDFPDPDLYYGVSWDSLVLVENILTRHTPDDERDGECLLHIWQPWPCPDAQAALNYIEGIR